MKNLLAALVLLITSILGSCAGVATATETPAEAVARAATRQVVCDDGRMFGSAVAIDEDTVVTAKHVAKETACTVTRANGSAAKVTETKLSKDGDFAVLHADVGCPCVADFARPERGESVIAIGYPYGSDIGNTQVLTRGEYQGEHKYHDTDDNTDWMAQLTTVPAAPGNSGGGVFAVRENKVYLVGVVIMVAPVGTLMDYAPIEMLEGIK